MSPEGIFTLHVCIRGDGGVEFTIPEGEFMSPESEFISTEGEFMSPEGEFMSPEGESMITGGIYTLHVGFRGDEPDAMQWRGRDSAFEMFS
jgi:hypothetical protein